jgi:hypothetical protein
VPNLSLGGWRRRGRTGGRHRPSGRAEAHTSFELAPFPARPFTALMLWDAELRKAWDPATYIPSVVRSSRAWGRQVLPDGDEHFWRISEQRGWRTGEFAVVIEEVFVNHRARRITFLGRSEARDEKGGLLRATAQQPLFHVEHAVGGTEDAPLILWRMVHLTPSRDEALLAALRSILAVGARPEYLDIYLRRDVRLSVPETSVDSPS